MPQIEHLDPVANERRMSQIQLRLFVSGQNSAHTRVARELRLVIARKFPDTCDLQVVDVCLCPELAATDGVLATPTLLRVSPLPTCRIVGELACRNSLALLGLCAGSADTAHA